MMLHANIDPSCILLAKLPAVIGVSLLVGVFFLVILIVVAASKAERQRKELLAKSLDSLGLSVVHKPDKDQKAQAFAALGGCWSKLRHGAPKINWFATGDVNDRSMTLVEHSYTVSTGKSSHTVYHSIAASPAPENWPTVEMNQEHLLHKIAEFLGSKDYRVEDEAFNKRWRIKVGDEDFALMVLTPEVQAWSMDLPGSTIVRIGKGAITIAIPSALRGDAAQELVSRCASLADMLPPELDAWESSSSSDGKF
ncbi:MAG: hypothetical protein IT435_18930 [Phycisphaerales bacterium]|nr:hypothetical protein [Phycisphaerales bacterium]